MPTPEALARVHIDALQIIDSRPYAQRRLTYARVKALAERLDAQQPNVWTTDSLWRAYARLEKDKDPSKMKYEKPKGPETEGLPELPEGWCWASPNQLAS